MIRINGSQEVIWSQFCAQLFRNLIQENNWLEFFRSKWELEANDGLIAGIIPTELSSDGILRSTLRSYSGYYRTLRLNCRYGWRTATAKSIAENTDIARVVTDMNRRSRRNGCVRHKSRSKRLNKRKHVYRWQPLCVRTFALGIEATVSAVQVVGQTSRHFQWFIAYFVELYIPGRQLHKCRHFVPESCHKWAETSIWESLTSCLWRSSLPEDCFLTIIL